HEHRTQDVGVAPHRKEVVTNMQNLIARARRWLTIERRQAIYAAVAAVVPILVYAGLLSSGAVEHIMTLTQVTIQILAGTLALLNYTPRAAASWFVNQGRAAVYALAILAAPAA